MCTHNNIHIYTYFFELASNSNVNPTLQSLLCGPLEIICPWFIARQVFNHHFQHCPEPYLFQRIVEPTGGDTEVGLVWGHMVHSMVSFGEDEVKLL